MHFDRNTFTKGKKALVVSNLAVLQNGSEKVNHEESSQQKPQAGLAKKKSPDYLCTDWPGSSVSNWVLTIKHIGSPEDEMSGRYKINDSKQRRRKRNSIQQKP